MCIRDRLFVDAVAFMVNGEKRMVDNKHLLRKSNDDIKFIIPDNFEKGDVVSLQLIFKNGETMDLDEKIDIVIPWQNPFALCDPITDETFMITDFEHEDMYKRQLSYSGFRISGNERPGR